MSMLVSIEATVIVDSTTLVGVGTVLTLDLLIDDAFPDTNPAPNDFAALNVGTLSSFLIVPVGGTIDSLTATPTSWDADITLDLNPLLPILLPGTVTTVGVGATPDQVLPDYFSLTSGLLWVDVGVVVAGGTVQASIDSITISVPEPAPSVLLGLAAVGFLWRRPRS